MLVGLVYFFAYIEIFLYLILIAILAGLFLLVAKILSPTNIDHEKVSVYECGFDPFISTRVEFDISFIAIAILYLIFDLEIIVIIPWILYYNTLGSFAFIVIFLFFTIILVGFFYECLRGSLRWI
jgi:NADH:ubiquinone oxidoreductase subunit 3 (subunit A)